MLPSSLRRAERRVGVCGGELLCAAPSSSFCWCSSFSRSLSRSFFSSFSFSLSCPPRSVLMIVVARLPVCQRVA